MNIVAKAAVLPFVALSLLAATGGAPRGATYTGSDSSAVLYCKGGVARVEGSENAITFKGPCSGLIIEGSSNAVQVQLTQNAFVKIEGSENQISWNGPPRMQPKVRINGSDNQVVRRR